MKIFKNDKTFQEAALADQSIYAEFIKRWVAEENKPLGFKDLEYCFTDYEGKKYYSFKEMTMPVIRQGKHNEFMMWLSTGLTAQQLHELVDACNKTLMDGLGELTGKKKQPINLMRVGALLNEMKTAVNVSNCEVLYNLLAISVVREDEKPAAFDEEIHEAKVQQFLKDAHGENRFFFLVIDLNEYLRNLGLSKENLPSILEDYKGAKKRHERVLEGTSSSRAFEAIVDDNEN